MRRYLRLIRVFITASTQQMSAYRTNFFISLLHSLLNFGTGILGLVVLFGQVETLRGWSFSATLAVLGAYLTVGALRDLFISPSLDALTGMDGEVWQGRFDFTLLRPIDTQFLASFRHWRPLALFDLLLGLGVLTTAVLQMERTPTPAQLLTFLGALGLGVTALYAILLAFAGLVFWSPGFLFSWVFDGVFQMARYPVGLYPGGLRLILTWLIPVGVITTVPAQALSGDLPPGRFLLTLGFVLALLVGASFLFRRGLRRYVSASS
jgi:ABC-2 type transport system permease protein